MSVTRQDVANKFKVKESSVKQVDSKHLFEVYTPAGYFLVSYYTIVGQFLNDTWYLTKEKYSRTTSKQLSQFARGRMVVYVNDINNIPVQ